MNEQKAHKTRTPVALCRALGGSLPRPQHPVGSTCSCLLRTSPNSLMQIPAESCLRPVRPPAVAATTRLREVRQSEGSSQNPDNALTAAWLCPGSLGLPSGQLDPPKAPGLATTSQPSVDAEDLSPYSPGIFLTGPANASRNILKENVSSPSRAVLWLSRPGV